MIDIIRGFGLVYEGQAASWGRHILWDFTISHIRTIASLRSPGRQCDDRADPNTSPPAKRWCSAAQKRGLSTNAGNKHLEQNLASDYVLQVLP